MINLSKIFIFYYESTLKEKKKIRKRKKEEYRKLDFEKKECGKNNV